MSRHSRPWARQEETVFLAGSFATDGAGALEADSERGKGFTVAAQGSGVYRVSFTSDGTRKYPRIISVVASVEDNAESIVSVVSTTASNGYVDLQTRVAGAAAVVTSARVHFIIVAQNSSVT
jgi:hypothetical protein